MSVPSTPPPRLEMRGITKRFPGVIANNKIDLDVKPGEIHALLGENGAGKTTLMNILFGLTPPDEGEILLDGKPVQIADPNDAIARGIGMVHQHFMLIPVLTVAENILLGAETMANAIFLDRQEARRRIIELGKRFGFEIDPDAKVETLSVGWQQRVEILKDGAFDRFVAERYGTWKSELGTQVLRGRSSLPELERWLRRQGEPKLKSGRQELLENLLNTYLE